MTFVIYEIVIYDFCIDKKRIYKQRLMTFLTYVRYVQVTSAKCKCQ